MTPEPLQIPADAVPGPAGDLCVFIECQGFLGAISVSGIERLILADEIESSSGALASFAAGTPLEGRDLVGVDGWPFVAWDLSLLLSTEPLTSAFILLRIIHGGHEIPLALRTGPCLFVEPLRAITPVPAGAFRSRRGAIAGAFSVATSMGGKARSSAKLGLFLDPRHLWTHAELDASVMTLKNAGLLGLTL